MTQENTTHPTDWHWRPTCLNTMPTLYINFSWLFYWRPTWFLFGFPF